MRTSTKMALELGDVNMTRFYSSDDIIDFRDRTKLKGSISVMVVCEVYDVVLTKNMEMKKALVNNYHDFISENKERIDMLMGEDNDSDLSSLEVITDDRFVMTVMLRDGQKIELIPWIEPHNDSVYTGYKSTSETILYATSWYVDGKSITSYDWDVIRICNDAEYVEIC